MARRSNLIWGFLAAVILTLGVALPQQASAIGLLIPPDGGHTQPFEIERHRVDVTIKNTAAVTRVEQVFRNNTGRQMEATFVFPLPAGATVSDFSLWINGKKTQGAVLDEKEARQTYESIVRRMKDPGLVEYMDGRLFKASIFPIPPNGTQKLELKFNQVLDRRGGFYRYSYPMHVDDKYVAAKTKRDFTFTADIQAPAPISTVYSPTHDVSVNREGDKKVKVGAEEMGATLDRDFQLYIGHSKEDVAFDLMAYDPDGDGGDEGYFMASMAPTVDIKPKKQPPQAYTFVIDTSGSMSGEKIKQARETLSFCIERLDTDDMFNVVRFSTGVETLFTGLKKGTKANRKEGRKFAEGLEAAGGTAIESALSRALDQEPPNDRNHHVIFVTDGLPTIGETEPAEIRKAMEKKLTKDARIFTFGVGNDVDTKLMDGLAKSGRGHSDYVKPGENLEQPISALYTRISSPVLSDVKVDFGKADVFDVYPNPLPDLFKGDQIVIFGRYRDGFSSDILLKGKAGGSKQVFEFSPDGDVSSDESMAFVSEIWATRKVGYLLEQIRLNGENEELKSEVVRLAKKFGLVTPYTSYLAVDDSEMQGRADRDRPPRPVPEPSEPEPLLERRIQGSASDSASAEMGRGGGGREQKRRARSDKFEGFGKSTGEEAVEAAEATQDYKDKATVDDGKGRSRRFVAGRTFVKKSDGWVQDGVDAGGDDVKEVEAYSKAYFELLKKHPEFKAVAKLGERITVELGGTVYRIVPSDS